MARNGRHSPQDELYARAARAYGAMIERMARGYEADAEARRDLVQDIHGALWRSFAIYEGQCSEKSWVYRIAHNVGVTHMITGHRRRKQALVGLEQIGEPAADGDIEAELADRTAVEALLKTIHRLNPADRQVILLYLEDLTASEIGEVTGLSAGAVAVRIHRIKALLAERHGAKDDEHE
jgi:RNA polymerase sigma-70 factor (ECF subfamily)